MRSQTERRTRSGSWSMSAWRERLRKSFRALLIAGSLSLAAVVHAQSSPPLGTPPGADASCTVTALNRTAPLQSDYSFTIYDIPGAAAFFPPQGGVRTPPQPFRVRATCSDGTVGETELAYPEFDQTVVYTGAIFWGQATPIPLALNLLADDGTLVGNATTQLHATGILADASTIDVTTRAQGTSYTSSNPGIATVSENGLVRVAAVVASGSSARVVMTAQHVGVAGSAVIEIGPRGRIAGRVVRADGSSPAAGAEVSIIRVSPRETLSTIVTDGGGNYALEDVGAGAFTLSVLDPATGDMGRGNASIANEGDTGTADIRLNGQGTVNVTVVSGADAPVANALVSFTSLSGFRDIRTLQTDAAGRAVFARALAGQFTVSTRAGDLVGAALGNLTAGGSADITLRLQPVGAIAGAVFAADGATVQEGVQVRLVSAVRGIITQAVTGADGSFRFDSLPLSDSPYILDAFHNGRLRTRVPGLILTDGGQQLTQNIVFGPVGTVTGTVRRSNGVAAPDVTINLQSQVGQRFAFTARTDAQGRYRIDAVPVGAFSLTAIGAIGEVASGSGSVVADAEVVVDMQLAANGIIGTVFQRDGVTPAGAGVSVRLNPGNVTVLTNAQGEFGFSVTQPNRYVIEAADAAGNRGQTELILTTIGAGNPARANVTFLGRGVVQGVVRDPNHVVQANAPVRLTSSSIFGGVFETNANAQGTFRFEGVFVGDFSVYARNPSTGLAGLGQGRVAGEGDTVATDVTLAATGSVSGQVVRQDNATPVAGALVELFINGTRALSATADGSGNYSFAAVPLGDFRLDATSPLDGDKGRIVSRLTTLNESRTANIRLIGVGTVRVHAIDSNGTDVAGATVTVESQSVFGGRQTALTDSAGIATFAQVFNGDFTASATKGAGTNLLSGSASGTMIGGATQDVQLTMTSTPVGTLAGIVSRGLSADPQPGVEVRLQPLFSGATRTITTNADGAYQFTQVEVGRDYRVTALVNGRVRARIEVRLSNAGETLTRNLALLGIGAVSGVVTDSQAQPRSGVQVTLTNSDPTYGGTWTATTQGDGSYSLSDVSAGPFTIRARSSDGRLQAQSSGLVQFDNDAVAVNLTLIDSAVTMPRTLYDANVALLDIQGNGAIGAGVNGVFRGDNSANTQGNRLDVVVGSVAVPFQNGDGSVGRQTQAGQLLEVDELNAAAGLDITRRIYVPKTGYFARYLEVLENRTANPITVGIRVSSNFAQGYSGARVVDSSNGDNVLSAGDSWVVSDDDRDADPFAAGAGNPAVVHVFDGADGEMRAAAMGTSLVGDATRLYWQWDAITIPAGGSVGLMHFVAQQVGRISARATAERLAQLPPEALEGLTAEERALVRNFRVPLDGLSTLQPLPPVEGNSVSGLVLAGDGVTVVPDAWVTYKNVSPYYGRTYRVSSDATGRYTLRSENIGEPGSIALVRDRFSVVADHPRTYASTGGTEGRFIAGLPEAEQDLVFAGTGNLRGTVRRHNGTLITSGTATIPYRFPGSSNFSQLPTSIHADGSYEFTGLTPGSYLVSAQQSHPQGTALSGSAAGAVTVSAGNVSTVDAIMEPTGEVVGSVRDAIGNAAVNVGVSLTSGLDGLYSRGTRTDTGGNYRFIDARLGPMTVRATGANEETASASTTVTRDATSTVDLQLTGSGAINVQVNYARGAPAINAEVYFRRQSHPFGDTVRTNAAGLATLSDARVGVDYDIIVYHPDNRSLTVNRDAHIATVGGVVDIAVVLPGTGSITGIVFRPDGATRATNVPVTVRSQAGTSQDSTVNTDATGSFRINGLPLGAYTATAVDAASFKFADADATLTTDGQEVSLSMTLTDNRVALPADLRDANDFQYDIQRNGSIGGGWRNAQNPGNRDVFNGGASALRVAGQAFTGDNSATLEIGRRQFSIRQTTPIAGLNVTRKVFVPRNGYFARYLEILENPSASAVSVPLTLSTTYAGGDTRIITTASGDDVLSAGDSADAWAILDDSQDVDPFISYSAPATAFVISGEGGVLRPDSISFASNAVQVGWSTVTVPAGGRVVLLHFEVQQVNRAGTRAAVDRLMQLPPEAVQSLSPSERAAMANFTLPAEEISTVEPLPNLLGSVSGTVYEGNGSTIVPNTHIQVRSTHPLYGRTWVPKSAFDYAECEIPPAANSLRANAQGAYRLTGELKDVGSIAIPVGSDLEIRAAQINCSYWASLEALNHPRSGVPSPVFVSPFTAGSASVARDVIFATGILEGRLIGPDGFDTTSAQISTVVDGRLVYAQYTNATQSYVLPGMPAGDRTLAATAYLARGGDLVGTRPVSIVVGQRLVADIPMEPTGSVIGTVVTANGEAVAGGSLQLTRTGAGRPVTRYTTSDSLGRFDFTAVPVGQYTLSAIDPRTQAVTSVSLTVTENQVTTQSVTLIGTGAVTLTVNFARGVGAVDADVYLRSPAISSSFTAVGRTNSQGRLNVLVPMGTYTIRARHPADIYGNLNTARDYSGSISANNEAQTVSVTLPALANVRVTAVDADAGNTPIANAQVRLTDAGCSNCYVGNTNGSGQFVVSNVREGSFSVRVTAPDGRPATSSGVVNVAVDGQTIEKTIAVTSRLGASDVLSFGGERHLYSVAANAGDVIGVYINGVQVGSTASSYITRAEIYSTAKVRLASGYGYDNRNSNQQYNESGDLRNVPAQVAGYYTVAVSPYYNDGRYLGGYRLELRINGETVETLPYFSGGAVQGLVTRGDNAPAADQLLLIQGHDTLALTRRIRADATGNYRFERVPVAGFTVGAVDAQRSRIFVSTSGSIAAPDDVQTRNLQLPVRTALQVQVLFGAGVSLPSQIWFELNDATGYQQIGPLNVNASTRSTEVYTVNGYGSSVTTRVYHPSANTINSFITVEGAEGETRSMVHTLSGATLSGTVTHSDGTPAQGVRVEVRRVADDGGWTSTYTDTLGRYQFAAIAAGQELQLTAQHPDTSVYSGVRITPQAAESLVRDLQLAGVGTVTGRLTRANGQPIPDSSIYATYVYDDLRNYTTTQYGNTDDNGEFTIATVPSGRLIAVTARVYTQFGEKEVRAETTIANHGGTQHVDLVVESDPGRVLASVMAADGTAVPGSCQFTLRFSSGGEGGGEGGSSREGSSYGPCSAVEFVDVPVGNSTLTALHASSEVNLGSVGVTVTGSSTPVEAVVRVSVVKGVVRFADGAPVSNPYVYLYSDSGYYPTRVTDENGNYALYAVPAGAFTLEVQDEDSGLYAEASGSLLDVNTPVMLDVTLPPAGTVLGTVINALGAPIEDAEVYVHSSELDLDRQTYTDASGSYQIDSVAAGEITVWARDPDSGLVSIGTGQLASQGQVLRIDLVPPTTAALNGRVLGVDGTTTVGSASVTATTVTSFGPFELLEFPATSAADGSFVLEPLPLGDFRVMAVADGVVGRATATLDEDGTSVDVRLGDEVTLPFTLSGADGSRYDVGCQATLNDGGFGTATDAYDYSYRLTIDNWYYFPCVAVADTRQSGRELVFGPYEVSRIMVSRQVYVPPAGGYARYLEVLRNPGATDITVSMHVQGYLGSYPNTQILVSPASTGNRYAVTSDSGTDPTLAHVFAGAGAPAAGTFQFVTSGYMDYSWSVVIPAGGQVSFLHFAIQRSDGDTTGARQQAEMLANGTQPGMFDGLSAADRASIRNFVVAP